jgi:hypothetical protein
MFICEDTVIKCFTRYVLHIELHKFLLINKVTYCTLLLAINSSEKIFIQLLPCVMALEGNLHYLPHSTEHVRTVDIKEYIKF